MTDLTTMQRLGLAPLTGEQKAGRVQIRIDELMEAYCLPRWAYLESEFRTFRDNMIDLVKELRSIQRRGV